MQFEKTFSMIFWIDNSIPEDQLERTFFGTMISLVARLRDHFYHREKLLTCIRIWAQDSSALANFVFYFNYYLQNAYKFCESFGYNFFEVKHNLFSLSQ